MHIATAKTMESTFWIELNTELQNVTALYVLKSTDVDRHLSTLHTVILYAVIRVSYV